MVQTTAAEQVLQSSQVFIRALKSSTDPPDVDGPTKIQIARMGWDSRTLYVPRKAGLILDWIVTRFHKEKSRRGIQNPLLDVDHWSLLADIVACPGDTQIEPIIQRASIPVLVASFITLYPTVPTDARHPLLNPFLHALKVIWPLAVQRVGLDPLFECLWPSFSITDQFSIDAGDEGLVDTLTFVFTGFRAALNTANATGRKKAYTALSQHQFIPWLRALHFVPHTHNLHHLLYSLGTDILYNTDSLRTVTESNPHAKSNSDIFSTLFGPFTAHDLTVQRSFLRVLPSLYKDYVVALHKHRASLFLGAPAGQQTGDRIRHAALRFGDECLAYLMIVEGEEVQESVWQTMVDILRVTEKDAMSFLTGNDPSMIRMEQVGEAALKILDRAWDDSHSSLATHALDVHSCLQRIQHDLGVQFVPRVLERLVIASPLLDCPVMTFLTELTTYHSKTRTLHMLISHVLATLISSPFSFSSDPQAMYIKCTRSPLMSMQFMDEITNALRAFVTPGQADNIEQSIKEELERFLRLCKTSRESEWKRRKLSSAGERSLPVNGIADSSKDVIKFSLVARFATTALRTVLHTRTNNEAVERKTASLSSVDELISDALHTVFCAEDEAGETVGKSRGKRSRREAMEQSQWTRQCLSSTLFRLWYELFAKRGEKRMVCKNLQPDVNWIATTTLDKLGDTFKKSMDEDTFPELQLEIGRAMFELRAIQTPDSHDFTRTEWPALDTILGYIEANLITSGLHPTILKTHHSPPVFSKPLTALAIWGLMLEEHLPTIDELNQTLHSLHASEQQLDRFVVLIIRVQVELPSKGQDQSRSATSILQRALASASFWEFGNIRLAILSALDKQTSMLGSVDTPKLLSAVSSTTRNSFGALSKFENISLADVEAGVGVYTLLHYFPPEYLSRTSRAELAIRALNADIIVRVFSPADDPPTSDQVEWRSIFRSFVVRVAKQFQMKLIEDIASNLEWLAYLTLYDGPGKPNPTYIQVTLDLLLLIQSSAARGAIKTEGILLINVITHYRKCNPYSNWNVNSQLLVHRSLLQFFDLLGRDYKISSFQESVLSPLRELCASLERPLRSAVNMMINQPDPADFFASESIVEAWQAVLSLSHRFSMGLLVESFGQKLLANTMRIMRSGTPKALLVSDKFRATILSLLVTEGSSLLEHDCRAVRSVAAAYLYFTMSDVDAETACDITIARASKLSSVTQYGSVLGLIAEALQDGPGDQLRLIALIRLSTIFLRDAPERTSKLAHGHLAQCLRIFVTRPAFVDSSTALAMKTMQFLHCQCMERAASLNSSDVACILSIISRLSAGCSEHDELTSPSIFHEIVSILNSLVRLRRDLLGPLLPQLSMAVRQMLSNIRGIRPLLGVKQYRLVGDTFPKWINPKDPLGEAAARSLARLLTAFTTKSFVRNHGNETQKADSLARPFARHAPYVLLSYLRLMNDPLSVLSASMRRELEPGLFALCTMMGEKGRDTLMVQSLDVGGKMLLKSLWKEYDRQRYIGRG